MKITKAVEKKSVPRLTDEERPIKPLIIFGYQASEYQNIINFFLKKGIKGTFELGQGNWVVLK